MKILWNAWKLSQKKYSDGSFLFDDGFVIEDRKNEAFRFPVTFNTGFRFDYGNFPLGVSADEIIGDLDFLLGYSFVVFLFLTEGPDGEPLFKSFPEFMQEILP